MTRSPTRRDRYGQALHASFRDGVVSGKGVDVAMWRSIETRIGPAAALLEGLGLADAPTYEHKVMTTATLDALANDLFRAFSRAEYALKASGYNAGEGDAKADWTRFAREPAVEALIAHAPSCDLAEAIAFIIGAPPKKQVVKGGVLSWRESEPSTNSAADKLLIYVRRVRNNLFHGGKFNTGWLEPERSEPLLRHSLVVLREVIAAVPDVYVAYHG